MGFKLGPAKKIWRVKNSIKSIVPLNSSDEPEFSHSTIYIEDPFKVIDDAALNTNEQREEFDERSLLSNSTTGTTTNNTLLLHNELNAASAQTCNETRSVTVGTTSNDNTMERSNTAEPEQSFPLKNIDASTFMPYSTIREALLSHPKGPPILEAIDSGKFDERYRRAIVRIVTGELVKHCGNYPSDANKWSLAQALVEEFPALRCGLSTHGCEQYFDPVTKKGFITYRLENMRKNLTIAEKKYTVRKNPSEQKADVDATLSITEDEILQKIQLMKNTLPTAANKSLVQGNMCYTFHARREWIVSKQPSVGEIVDNFPRINDYNGELVELEYQRMTENNVNENANGLLSAFPTMYTKPILEYCKAKNMQLHEELLKDDDLRALALLISLLPRTNFSRKRKANEDVVKTDCSFPNKQFLQIKPNGINVEETIRQRSAEQAYLLAIETKQAEYPYIFFIVADSTSIQLHAGTSALAAVTLLWKFHYVFNIEYAKELKFFFNFIDCVLCKKEGTKLLPSIRSLNLNLLNFLK